MNCLKKLVKNQNCSSLDFFFHCSPVCWSLDYLVSNPNWYLIFSGFQNFFFQTKKSNFLTYLNICTWTVKQKRSLKDKLWSVQRWSFSDILKQLFKEEFICVVFIQNMVQKSMKSQLKMFWTVITTFENFVWGFYEYFERLEGQN